MTTGTKLLLGGLVLGAAGISYRNGVDNLEFGIDGFEGAPDGVNLMVRIKVINHNQWFGYPVPRMEVNAYDDSGNYIGSMVSEQLQYIPANAVSFIYAIAIPAYTTLVNVLFNIIVHGALPTGLQFDGWIHAGPVEIPFSTRLAISGPYNSIGVLDPLTDAILMSPGPPAMGNKLTDVLQLGLSWLS